MIQFFDEVLAPNALATVQSILAGNHWGFGYCSNDRAKPIWNFDRQVATKITDILMTATALKEYTLVDYHVNGQTILQDTDVHHDAGMGATHAFVFFPHSWNYTDGGHLHILTGGVPCVVNPQQNFGVLFDAKLQHYAQAPAQRDRLRVSVGLKLVRKSNGQPD